MTPVDELRRRRAAALDDARADAIARQHALGKDSARERITHLLDEGTFREFGGLVDAVRSAPGEEQLHAPADGVVTGTGQVDGRPVVVMSFDFTVYGGSNGTIGGLKVARCCERAMRDGTPLVMLLDGGGHRIQEGLDSHHFAHGFTVFQQMVELSGFVPVVAAMLGPGFAGPSNFAALADFVVMVRGTATMGIAGPALVRAATGERISSEELGGADVQARLGVADLAVDTEAEALDSLRVYLGFLPSRADQELPLDEPRAPVTDPGGVMPEGAATAYDVRDVVGALADADTVFELRAEHAPNVVTALVRLDGRPVGVVANQPLHLGGSLDSPACEKAAHFVSVCDAFGVPLLFLIDVPGFLVGSESARTQLARRSGRLLFELGQATVPRFSVVLRKGYGAAYIAMCGGRSFSADLALAWPTAEICAMSVDGAVDVAYRRDIAAAPDPAARRAELVSGFRQRVDPILAAQGFGVDDVVEPAETRSALIDALSRAPQRRTAAAVTKRHGISPI
ncbi:carboxyl transferase domain-containing protein [Pseudonocardia nematodicida]|uniref:Carboxyl transferase domain-containing protein n=1 Tax=Pseudonocardia nematodicida TaxID=1206997 RepID=A0ABV1KDW4_9PSEU